MGGRIQKELETLMKRDNGRPSTTPSTWGPLFDLAHTRPDTSSLPQHGSREGGVVRVDYGSKHYGDDDRSLHEDLPGQASGT